jgi:hypothetical protein
MLLREIGVVPVLWSVTVCGALAKPTSMVGNDKVGGVMERVLMIPVPVPDNATV